jgi:hypothetical protein
MARETLKSLGDRVRFLETIKTQHETEITQSTRQLMVLQRELAVARKYASELEIALIDRQLAEPPK